MRRRSEGPATVTTMTTTATQRSSSNICAAATLALSSTANHSRSPAIAAAHAGRRGSERAGERARRVDVDAESHGGNAQQRRTEAPGAHFFRRTADADHGQAQQSAADPAHRRNAAPVRPQPRTERLSNRMASASESSRGRTSPAAACAVVRQQHAGGMPDRPEPRTAQRPGHRTAGELPGGLHQPRGARIPGERRGIEDGRRTEDVERTHHIPSIPVRPAGYNCKCRCRTPRAKNRAGRFAARCDPR